MNDVAVPAIHGTWQDDLTPLVEEFRANFSERGEVGASLCVMRDGEVLVDVWGGLADPKTGTPWDRDTVSIVFSNTKPATATCLHLLVDRGMVRLDDPVSRYWPGYAVAGKGETTLRMLLDHSAGLPALREPLPDGAAFDWQEMTARLAAETPFWQPGTRTGYHGLTFGWLVGEVVRRVTGESLGAFFRSEIAERLGIDFWIGLPEEIEPRVAPIIPYRPTSDHVSNAFERTVMDRPDSISALYFRNTGGWRPSGFNSRRGHAAEIPAANGVTHARGLAGFYAALACGGQATGVPRLLSPAVLTDAVQVSSTTESDATLCVPTRFAAGFMRSMDNRATGQESAVLAANAFGHVGAGGSLGFADPTRGLSFGYTMNRMGVGVLLNPRGQRLVDCLDRLIPAV